MRRVSSRNIYFLLLCLCLLIFCGCGKKHVETTTEEMTTEEPATTEALETVALKDAEIGDIVQMEPTNRMEIRRQKIRSAGMCWIRMGMLCCLYPMM